jgi:hypothetical protein
MAAMRVVTVGGLAQLIGRITGVKAREALQLALFVK